MTSGFSEKERAFVDGLPAETGRDLAAWMAAIAASGHSHRNDIIDWLRQEGFTFSNASWLERIHHNGGRLIYAGAADKQPASPARRKAPDREAATASAQPAVRSAPLARPASPPADAGIDALLAAAKAYRPLAQVLLRDVLAAVPGAETAAHAGVIVVSHARPFAAIEARGRDVRLMLAANAGASADGVAWQRAKPPPGLDGLAALTHMLVLTDARQLTASLKDLIGASARLTAP